jgi:hypothetical protein
VKGLIVWVPALIAALATLCVVLAVVLPVRLRLTVRGAGQLGTTWAIASGVQLLFLTVSVAAAHGALSVLQVHAFGRQVLRRSPILGRGRKPPPVAPSEPPVASKPFGWNDLVAYKEKIERWFDLDRLFDFACGLRRRVRLAAFDGSLSYATSDLAFTGLLSGLLYALAGLVSPIGRFQVVPEWETVDRMQGDLHMVIAMWPLRVLIDTVVFVVKNIKVRKPRVPQVAAIAPVT